MIWVIKKKLVDDFMDKDYDVITFTSKCFYLRRPIVANFAGIFKTAIILIKTNINDSLKVIRIRNYGLKCSFYLFHPIWQKLPISGERIITLAQIQGSVTWFIYIWIFFTESITVLNFIIMRYLWPRPFEAPIHPWASPKRLILNRLRNKTLLLIISESVIIALVAASLQKGFYMRP